MRALHHLVLVDDNAGPDVTSTFLTKVAAAIQRQVREHWAQHWGHPGFTLTTGPAPSQGDPSVSVYLRASSDVEGAAGYHDDEGIYCFRDGVSSLDDFPIVISHEILEALTDPAANRWVDTGQGEEVALEDCDVIEGFSYEIDGIRVSDFLLPSYFDPEGRAPYSWLNKPTAPFTIAPDNGANYQIVRSVDENGVQQVTAAGLDTHPRKKAKLHPKSRTSRRGAR